MEKKISFGFSKVQKTNTFINKLAPKDDKDKIELIKCLEGQSIQLVKEKVEEAPLVIPLKDNRKTSAALLSLRTRQAVLNGEELSLPEEQQETEIKVNDKPKDNEAEDIEKRAARELLAEVGKGAEEDESVSTLVLPVKAEDLPLEGAKESTINDYESIPITQFGLAMLRGMGWKDVPKKKGAPIEEGPTLRPKGMGLGADKALKPKALLIQPEANEILEIKKGACVRILGGKHKDLYGQIEGLDDHAGRVIVKMALGSTKESFNEFMVQPVSKKEYSQYSKCINSAKYDEYKKMENENGQIIVKTEETVKKEIKDTIRPESSNRPKNKNDEGERKHDRHATSRRRSSESENYPRKTERRSRSRDKREEYSQKSTSHKKYSERRTPSRHRSKSNDSHSSDSTTYRSKHKKKSSKSKKSKKSKDKSREKRHSSQDSSEDERRHKKKTKKSKRGRSRSRSKGRR